MSREFFLGLTYFPQLVSLGSIFLAFVMDVYGQELSDRCIIYPTDSDETLKLEDQGAAQEPKLYLSKVLAPSNGFRHKLVTTVEIGYVIKASLEAQGNTVELRERQPNQNSASHRPRNGRVNYPDGQ